jgi:hypothetical protein
VEGNQYDDNKIDFHLNFHFLINRKQVKYENLLSEKEKLEAIIKSKSSTDEHQQLVLLKYKTYQLEQDNKNLRKKLNLENVDEHHRSAPESQSHVDKSFAEQVPVSGDHYKIPIAIRNKMVMAEAQTNENHKIGKFQMNEQQSQNVLQQPVPMNGKSSSTTTTTPTSVVKKENIFSPPKVQSTSPKVAKPLPKGLRENFFIFFFDLNFWKLFPGILPIPELKSDNEASKNHQNEELKSALDETLGKPQNIDESENGAHEVINDNDFNIEDKNPHNNIEDNFDPDKNAVNNDAAEEFDGNKPIDKKLQNDEMDLEIINRPGVKDKLNDEIAGDHGKEEDGYPEDLHMVEGANQEENDDLGDGEEREIEGTRGR